MSTVPPVDEIERNVTEALTGDRRAESRMLQALRPGVLAVLRFGAFHRWIDVEDLTQETLHIVVERVRARTIDDPRKVFARSAGRERRTRRHRAPVETAHAARQRSSGHLAGGAR